MILELFKFLLDHVFWWNKFYEPESIWMKKVKSAIKYGFYLIIGAKSSETANDRNNAYTHTQKKHSPEHKIVTEVSTHFVYVPFRLLPFRLLSHFDYSHFVYSHFVCCPISSTSISSTVPFRLLPFRILSHFVYSC